MDNALFTILPILLPAFARNNQWSLRPPQIRLLSIKHEYLLFHRDSFIALLSPAILCTRFIAVISIYSLHILFHSIHSLVARYAATLRLLQISLSLHLLVCKTRTLNSPIILPAPFNICVRRFSSGFVQNASSSAAAALFNLKDFREEFQTVKRPWSCTQRL